MSPIRVLIAAFAALVLANAALAKPAPEWPALGVETAILFPGMTVRDFEVDADRGFWLQDRQRRWYYARFRQPCPRLQSSGIKRLDTQGYARFDRTSVLWIKGQSCALEHFVTATEPVQRSWKKSDFRRPAKSEEVHS
jgi:hypothetical protein